jgi:SAM-dependent methyltransferase
MSRSPEIVTRTQKAYHGWPGGLWTLNHRLQPIWVLYGFIPWGSNLRAGERAVEAFTEEWERGTVLDLPVGMGRMFPYYASRLRPPRVIAVDLAEGMVERARRSAQRSGFAGETEFIAADVAALPLPDASVDNILTEGGFHHFPDRAAAMREFMRVLRPGGRIAGYGLVAGENRRGTWSLRLCHRAKLMGSPISAAELRSFITDAGAVEWREFRTGSLLCFAVRKPD